MTTMKYRWRAGLAFALLGGAVAVGDGRSVATALADKVEQRIRDWQPSREERRFDEIGWAQDIRDALRLAKEHGRPVFLFTYDGANLATYRC